MTEADHNFSSVDQRWLDSEFMVPACLLDGVSEACIRIIPFGGVSWSEYRYWVYSRIAAGNLVDSDADLLPDAWELDYAASLVELAGPQDSDADGFSDLEEYRAGTAPLNPLSFPVATFSAGDQAVVIDTRLGRLYSIQRSGSLLSNQWEAVKQDIPGSGGAIAVAVEYVRSNAFYRFEVEKP